MAEENKKTRKKRRAYLDDFYMDAAGKYVYRGKLYRYAGGTDRKAALVRLWLLAGGALAALVINGLVPNPALSGCFYVVVPYVTGLIAGCSVVWALGRITCAGDPLRAYVYEETVQQLPVRCMIGVISSGIAAAGQLIYLLVNGLQQQTMLMLLFIVLEIVATVALYALKRFISVLEWRTGV